MSNIPEIGGKVILLYQASEAKNIESAQDVLKECGVIPIPCKNPNNFRFVAPEIVAAAQMDLIARAALQALGSDRPMATFAMAVRNALAPTADATQDKKK